MCRMIFLSFLFLVGCNPRTNTQQPPQACCMGLALPAQHFIHPYQFAKSEEERLKDWIKKNHDVEDVFITPNGQEDKLKEYGWERVPFRWRDLEIWIKRKPKSDKRTETSA